MSGAGSSPAGSISRDLNSQKLNYQYLTTSVALVAVLQFCVQCCVFIINVCPVHAVDLNQLTLRVLPSSLDKNALQKNR